MPSSGRILRCIKILSDCLGSLGGRMLACIFHEARCVCVIAPNATICTPVRASRGGLLDEVRRVKHYGLRTGQICVGWTIWPTASATRARGCGGGGGLLSALVMRGSVAAGTQKPTTS